MQPKKKTEIIAISSGKGGTGKTLIAASLGYALIRSGHRVLLIDADTGTDGLSLFMLGPKGKDQIESFGSHSTLRGFVSSSFAKKGALEVVPQQINRKASDDHGIIYNALISGRELYGDEPASVVLHVDQGDFRQAVAALFNKFRKDDQYDYVLVDTRGGFSFESTDICALADSFLIVTEADVTSFYQDRNLVKHIHGAARELNTTPLLRAIFVNKATEGEEESFRLLLEREFPIKFSQTHPIPLDVEVMKAYKTQKIPYLAAPASLFCFATLSAFADMLQIVTAQWEEERIDKWNSLVKAISDAISERNEKIKSLEVEMKQKEKEFGEQHDKIEKLQKEIILLTADLQDQKSEYEKESTRLKRELQRTKKTYERELSRSEQLGKVVTATKEKSGFSRYTSWQTVLVIILSVITIGNFIFDAVFQRSPNKQIEQPRVKVYDSFSPLSSRVNSLKELYREGERSFDGVDLSGGDLSTERLSSISFRRASLVNVTLIAANLDSANLTDANLRGANLSGASFRKAILRNARLNDVQFEGTDFRGAILIDADIDDTTSLALTVTDRATVLPDGSRGPYRLPKQLELQEKRRIQEDSARAVPALGFKIGSNLNIIALQDIE